MLGETIIAYLCNSQLESQAVYDSVCVDDLTPLPNTTSSTKFTPGNGIVFFPGNSAIDADGQVAIFAAGNLTSNVLLTAAIDVQRPGMPSIRWISPSPGDWDENTFPMIVNKMVFLGLATVVVALDLETGNEIWRQVVPPELSPGVFSSDGKFAYWGQGPNIMAVGLNGLNTKSVPVTVVAFDAGWGTITSAIAVPKLIGAKTTTMYAIIGEKVVKLVWDYTGPVTPQQAAWIFELSNEQKSVNDKSYRFVGISITPGVAVIAGSGTVTAVAISTDNHQQFWAVYNSPNSTGVIDQWTGPAALGYNGTVYHSGHASLTAIESVLKVDVSELQASVKIQDNLDGTLNVTWRPMQYTDWFYYTNYVLTVSDPKNPKDKGRNFQFLIPTTSLGSMGGVEYTFTTTGFIDEADVPTDGLVLEWGLTFDAQPGQATADLAAGSFKIYRHKVLPTHGPKPHKGMSPGGKAALAIFLIALFAGMGYGGFVLYKRKGGSLPSFGKGGKKEAYVAF